MIKVEKSYFDKFDKLFCILQTSAKIRYTQHGMSHVINFRNRRNITYMYNIYTGCSRNNVPI